MIRHSRHDPCRVCRGHPDLPRGHGERDFGFRSDDGRFEHCTREEYAGSLELHAPSGSYAHRLDGPCTCGVEHSCARDPLDRPAVPRPLFTAAERTERARAIWCAAKLAAGTPVERYLRGRGITGLPPSSLRFAVLWHAPTRCELPAMVARVDNVRGELIAIHRTFLRPDGFDRIDKRMLGPCRGGAVRLGPPARKLALAEGIETALSIMTAIPELSTWAALSTSGLRTIELPAMPLAAEVTGYADADPAGIEAAKDAGRRFARQGRRVRLAIPEGGADDFNDILRGVG